MEVSQAMLRAELHDFATSALREELLTLKESLLKELQAELPKPCGDALQQHFQEASEAPPRPSAVKQPAGEHYSPPSIRAVPIERNIENEQPPSPGMGFSPLSSMSMSDEEGGTPSKLFKNVYKQVADSKLRSRFMTADNVTKRPWTSTSRYSMLHPEELLVSRESSRGVKSRGWQQVQDIAQGMAWSDTFEYISVAAVLLNILWIGIETDWISRHWSHEMPSLFFAIDLMFIIQVVGELTVRIVASGRFFFLAENWRWNVFDLIVSATQIADAVVFAIYGNNINSKAAIKNLRIIKIFRILRVARIAVAFPELNILMSSIAESLSSLFWVMLLIFVFLYAVAILINQMVSDHKISMGRDKMQADESKLIVYFDTLDATIISLYKVISSGIDWDDLVRPLEEEISPWIKYFFVVFVGFQLFALLNVITANFVDHANKLSRKAEAEGQVAALWDMLGHTPVGNGQEQLVMAYKDFEAFFDHPVMLNFRGVINAEDMTCENLFRMFDANDDGTISTEEFLQISSDLIGPAQAIVLAKLELRIKDFHQFVERKLAEQQEVAERLHAEAMDRWPFRTHAGKRTLSRSPSRELTAPGGSSRERGN
eukprot:TRINITY_DN76798_c0_g1_i1.p1 TRINITY_DN76798_c0_g1~~TRINITY_DN76798_c0_g1_i1.p1  ORF type:complete len:607 (+),score=105.69 TRINITY_DN76798_c0_g1_i1:23-1822(+)